MSMSTRCQTTCFQTLARTQDGVYANSQKQRRITPRSLLLRQTSSHIHKEIKHFPKVLFIPPHLRFLQLIKWHLFIRASLSCSREVEVEEWWHSCTSDFGLLFLLGMVQADGAPGWWCVIWGGYQDKELNSLPLCWHIPIKSIFFSPLSEYNQIK